MIAEGEAMVNQASLTGESVPVRKVEGNSVYAGTVVEEGEAVLTDKSSRRSKPLCERLRDDRRY